MAGVFLLCLSFYLVKKTMKPDPFKNPKAVVQKYETLQNLLFSYIVSFSTFLSIATIMLWISRRWNVLTEVIMPAIVVGHLIQMFLCPGFRKNPENGVLLA